MTDLLRLALIQTSLHWEDAMRNRETMDAHLADVPADVDLILLPETFSSGFSMQVEKCAETMEGATVTWMQSVAKQRECVIAGSLIITENGHFYNRFLWVRPDGTISTYDKHHLFRMGEENEHFTAGSERLIVELKGWRICPQVCYDLRFPVWSRNQALDGTSGNPQYDLLLYVANWPAVRSNVWSTLLMARAMENQCYVAGTNRVGAAGEGTAHTGDSAIIDPKGDPMATAAPDVETILTATLSISELEKFRKRFPIGKDADQFTLK